jgi:hypothetical protein
MHTKEPFRKKLFLIIKITDNLVRISVNLTSAACRVFLLFLGIQHNRPSRMSGRAWPAIEGEQRDQWSLHCHQEDRVRVER